MSLLQFRPLNESYPHSACFLAGALRNGNKLADTAADLLPASVPRGAAKVGVIGVGGLVAFWLLQKVGYYNA